MKLSVIVPTLGDRPELENLLEALSFQNFPSAEREVIVVGNLESDALRARIAAWQPKLDGLRLVFSGQVGVNFARNFGLSQAQGKIFVFFDDDCVPAQANYLAETVRLHEKFSQASAIGGFYVPGRKAGALARAYVAVSRAWLRSARVSGEEALDLVGGNVSYKRNCLGETWRFNPAIVFGGAETEFHGRLLQAGQQLVLREELPVFHLPRFGVFGFFRRAFLQGYRLRLLAIEGMAPRFQTYVSQNRRPRSFWEWMFVLVSRIGADFYQIGLYESRWPFQLWEFFRKRKGEIGNWLRARHLLRELCYGQLALSEAKRER